MLVKLAIPALVCAAAILAGCGRDKEPAVVKRQTAVMGTTLHMVLISDTMTESELEAIATSALEEVNRVEKLMSSWVKDSDVNRLNAAGGNNPVVVDLSTFEVVKMALRACEVTEGAFEITVSPLVDLWGFGAKSKESFSIPSAEAIQEALTHVGHDKVVLHPETTSISFTEDGVTIDLAGIAKGYGVDRAMKVLKDAKVRNALVEIGGEVSVVGRNAEGKAWSVGVRHPVNEEELIRTLELENEAVATSGDYENYFEVDGVRYSHIIDPRTGMPTTSRMTSVTIVSESCAWADALATGLSVLPYEEGIKLIESMPKIEGILVRRNPDGPPDIYISDGLKDKTNHTISEKKQ